MKTGRLEANLAQPAAATASCSSTGAPGKRPVIRGPSSLYRAWPWNACVRLSRILPERLLVAMAKSLTAAYRLACPARAEVVFNNLLPACAGDRAAARAATRELFQNFAVKLADLWRYESGRSIDTPFAELSGWEHFEAAQARGLGVLLVTVHLGNWEFGAPLLTSRGVRLQVITQAEPDPRLTASRQAARARWGIDTLPLGDDPFAAVEIIRRLEASHTIALLMDRPPAATAAKIKFFGQPFAASISAAEFARATGCAVLPVYLPRTASGYAVHALPEISYERATLRAPAARLDLTQRILDAFAPAIREHASQWYHFVPVWGRKGE